MVKQHKWLIPALIVLIILGAVIAGYFLSKPVGRELEETMKITLDEGSVQTAAGIDLNSTFLLTNDFVMDEQTISEKIKISPSIAYSLQGSGREWKLIPNDPLTDNTVYTFEVKDSQGKTIQSFAFQTKGDLLVSRVYPDDRSEWVNPETGIEIVFNAENVDLSAGFEIMPPVTGKFTSSGSTSIFVPTEPLAYGSIYRVTIKAGLTSEDGRVLQEPYEFTFETVSEDNENWEEKRLSSYEPFSRTYLPGDPVFLRLEAGQDYQNEQFQVTIHKFAGINAYSQELRGYDQFYKTRYGKKEDYVVKTDNLEEVFNTETTLLPLGEDFYSGYYLPLPDSLSEGQYVVTLTNTDSEGSLPQFVQKIFEITPVSIYSQSLHGETLFWLNDPANGQPLSEAEIMLEDSETGDKTPVTTKKDGTATLVTKNTKKAYVSVTREGSLISFSKHVLSSQEKDTSSSRKSLSRDYYAALYLDRTLYQPTDTVYFWGTINPRKETTSMPETVKATLRLDWPEEEIHTIDIKVSADGTFSGEIPVKDLRDGSYQLAIRNADGNYFSQKYINVEPFVKPAYRITVTTDKPIYNFQEKINFNISATYYDGTPAAGIKLNLSCYNMRFTNGTDNDLPIVLDQNGTAQASGKMQLDNSDPKPMNWRPSTNWYSIYSTDEQDAFVSHGGTFTILPSDIAMKVTSETPDRLTIETAVLDESKVGESRIIPYNEKQTLFDALAGAPVDIPVTVLVYQVKYIREPVSTSYDAINKETITNYHVRRQENMVRSLPVQTVNGKAVLEGLPYQNTEDETYWFELRFDGKYAGTVLEQTQQLFRAFSYKEDSSLSYSFISPESTNDEQRLAMGENYTLRLYENGKQIENQGRLLMTVVQDKILSTDVYSESEKTISMSPEFLPSVEIVGAYFDGRHIYPIFSETLTYDYQERELDVKVTTDKETYLPGETAQVTLTVTDKAGNPVEASACIGVVDESVFALAPQNLELLDQLYQIPYSNYIIQNVSYIYQSEMGYDGRKPVPNTAAGSSSLESAAAVMDTGGGGEEAGAGMVRSEFKDTAYFAPVQVDASGKASVSVPLPENITSWRFTGAAIASGMRAGESIGTAATTLPFYIRPIVTSSYLTGDDLSMSVNSMGDSTALGDKISVSAVLQDEKGETLETLKKEGAVGKPVYFQFGKQKAGNYTVIFEAQCGQNTDRMQLPVYVYDSTLLLPVYKTMDFASLSTLESAQYPIRFTFFDEQLTPYMNVLSYLNGQSSDNTEILVAAYKSKLIYNEMLEPEDRTEIYRDPRLDALQPESYREPEPQKEEAIAIPSTDPSTGTPLIGKYEPSSVAKILLVSPDLLSKSQSAEYFRYILMKASSTKDDRVMSYLGLAAADEPVLLDIKRMLEQDNASLTNAQKLYLGAGLACLGDFSSALQVYDSMKDIRIQENGLLYMDGNNKQERLHTTAAALMLTSLASSPDADSFARYLVSENGGANVEDKILCHLELLCYLNQYKPNEASKASFSYIDLEGNTQKVTFSASEMQKSLSFTASALQSADFKTLSGKIGVMANYMVPAPELQVSESDKIKITKQYTPLENGPLYTGQRVKVTLTVTFDDSVPNGCYMLTDEIPSGMRFVNVGANMSRSVYHSSVENAGQKVYINLYRNKESLKDTSNERTYTITYLLSASLPGTFITESTYLTPRADGLAAKSERGQIAILPPEESEANKKS